MRIIKSNSKKRDGFGLIEVVISMAIVGIISMSVYSGYVLAIKHTKDGKVKQAAALEGKKVIEEMKSTDIQLPTNSDGTINIGDINLKEIGISGIYTRFLDGNFSDTNETSAKYAEVVSILPTNANTGGISFDNNISQNLNDINYPINVSEEMSNNTIKDYIYYADTSDKYELERQDTIILSMYLEYDSNDSNGRSVTITDYKGNPLFPQPNKQSFPPNVTDGKVNIRFNFSKYNTINSSSHINPVQINIYNKTTDVPNVYVEKSNSQDLNVDVEIFKGQMNFYDNRAENPQEAKIGTLQDVEVQLMDYSEYMNYLYDITHDENVKKHDEKNNLFTAYYKENI